MERNLGKIFFDTYYLYIPEKILDNNVYQCKEISIYHQHDTCLRRISPDYLNRLKMISRQKAVSILNNYNKERSGYYKSAFYEILFLNNLNRILPIINQMNNILNYNQFFFWHLGHDDQIYQNQYHKLS